MKQTVHAFAFHGHRVVCEERGEGDRVLVLAHGIMLSRKMHDRLADRLATRGLRVICVDLLGHGESDHPDDLLACSVPVFAEQVVATLDYFGIDRAVVGGMSLGANTALTTGADHPERVRGLVVEAPVLEISHGLVATPLFGSVSLLLAVRPVAWLWSRAVRRVPRGRGVVTNLLMDAASMEPQALRSMIRGLSFNQVAPPSRKRREIAAPALVIGYQGDPLHPHSEIEMLLDDLPNGRYLQARNMWELRRTPERLVEEIAAFVHECWDAPAASDEVAPIRTGRGAAKEAAAT